MRRKGVEARQIATFQSGTQTHTDADTRMNAHTSSERESMGKQRDRL